MDAINITGFSVCTILSISGVAIVTKLKLPVWKLQLVEISILWLIGVFLLISQLTGG
jgi:hypothetical protein